MPHVSVDARIFWKPEPGISLGGSIGYVGRRFDDSANTVPLLSNTLVGFYGSYALTKSLQLYARVENAFDAHYEPAFGYGAAGRAVYGGIRAIY